MSVQRQYSSHFCFGFTAGSRTTALPNQVEPGIQREDAKEGHGRGRFVDECGEDERDQAEERRNNGQPQDQGLPRARHVLGRDRC